MTNIVKNRRDFYYRKAKVDGYRSRASYKLLQIQERYRIIQKGDIIVDLGAAPGGWLQVIRQLNATAIAVDLQQIAPLEGVTPIRTDITNPDVVVEKIQEIVGQVNVVVSDAAPNLSGVWSLDHARSIDLSSCALNIAIGVLKTGGNFVVKVFEGDLFNTFIHEVRAHFSFVKSFTPKASRKQSAEIYVVAKRYIGTSGPRKIESGDSIEV
jgi:23S rRNA (uridine2552-2'-O)-methyltransferase